MTTILDVLEKGSAFLSQKGVPDARLNMELLVAHDLGLKRMDLYLRFDQPLDDAQLSSLREKLKKRGQRIPLQHLNGVIHFGKYSFQSDSRALIPRPESEELVALAETLPLNQPTRLLDLGCGSGVLGLTLAKDLGTRCEQLTLADLSTEALSLCEQNAKSLGVAATLVQSDLFASLCGPFDLIVANLPYIPESDRASLEPEVLHDPELALFGGDDGLDLIRPFCQACPDFLSPGGWVALEVGHGQGQKVHELLEAAGLTDLRLASDLNGIPRFPLARKG